MNIQKIIFALVFLSLFSFSQSLSVTAYLSNSQIGQGSTTSLSANVQSIGSNSENVKLSVTLPNGLSTTDAPTISIGTVAAGQTSSTKSWNIKGDVQGTYSIVVTATSSSGSQQVTVQLNVGAPGFVVANVNQTPPTSTSYNSEFNLKFILKNTGQNTVTDISATPVYSSGLTLINGSIWTGSLNSGQQVAITWKFKATGYGVQSLSAIITAPSNDPNDLEYSVSVPSPSGPSTPYPSATPSPTPSATPTATPIPTVTPTITPTPTPVPTPLLFTRNLNVQNGRSTFTLSLTNNGNSPTTKHIVETIPKSVAEHVDEIQFSIPPTIINPDPVVAWTITLAPSETKTITYTVNKVLEQSVLNEYEEPEVTTPTPTPTATPTATPAPTIAPTITPTTTPTITPEVIEQGFDWTLPILVLILIAVIAVYFFSKRK